MARKPIVKKSAKKTPTKKKSTKKTKRPTPTPTSRLEEGHPTSEAELTALFHRDSADEIQKKQRVPKAESAPRENLPKMRRHYFRWAVILVVVALVGGYVWLRVRLKDSLVPEEGSVTVKAIQADVTISRDAYGVPHIKAQTLGDMAFGAGFAMASDRNFQIEFLKRMAYGRLAEVVGSDALGVDIYMRSLGFAEISRKGVARLDARMQQMLKSFADGVNAQRKIYTKTPFEYLLLRLEVEEWKSEDSLALFHLFSFLLATNQFEELAFLKFAAMLGSEKAVWLFPVDAGLPLPFEDAAHLKEIDFKKFVAPPFEHQLANLKSEIDHADTIWQGLLPTPSLPASNNWVVAPARAKNGKSILANDTHLQLTVPALWYMMNVECPEYRAAGVALPGTPIVALGTNGTIAWGATMVMADNQDIFLEQLREENGKTQYLYKKKWTDVQSVDETIKIRGGKTHTFKRMRTRHGVLMNEALARPFPDKHLSINLVSDYGLAYRTTVNANDTTLAGIFSVASARTLAEARAELDKVTGIYLNVVYADEKNIAWLATGRYPVRKGPPGQFPRIGWSGEHDWDGYFARSENPAIVNPKEGIFATANNRISNDETELWVTASQYGADRADRAKELLSTGGQLAAADMQKFQGDTFSATAKKIKELLFSPGFSTELQAAIEQLPAAQNLKAVEALAMLKNFDGNLDKASAAAAVYENFASAMAILTFADELGGYGSPLWINFQGLNKRSYNAVQDHLLARADSPFWDNVTTAEVETKATIFAAALAEAIRLCEKQIGSNRQEWAWGKIHQYKWRHEFTKRIGVLGAYLNRGPYPAGGDLHTLNQAGNLWGDAHDVWLVPAMRFIVDFSADEPAQLMIHMGISGNAESKHYDDMIPLFTEVKNLPLPMKAANIEKQYTKKFVLKKG